MTSILLIGLVAFLVVFFINPHKNSGFTISLTFGIFLVINQLAKLLSWVCWQCEMTSGLRIFECAAEACDEFLEAHLGFAKNPKFKEEYAFTYKQTIVEGCFCILALFLAIFGWVALQIENMLCFLLDKDEKLTETITGLYNPESSAGNEEDQVEEVIKEPE